MSIQQQERDLHPDHVRDWIAAVTETKNILVVDDDKQIADLFCRIGNGWNCHIDTARSGPAAINLMKQKQYRIVFLDIQMPGVDGIETFEEIKRLKLKSSVVFISGYIDADTISRVQDVGFAMFVAKPFPIDSPWFDELFQLLGILKIPVSNHIHPKK